MASLCWSSDPSSSSATASSR